MDLAKRIRLNRIFNHPSLRLGADAIAVAIGVRGPNEGKFLRILAEMVEEADRIGLPVISHIYPRDFSKGAAIVFDHDNILWAVRCGIECGADVIKVPFTGDIESFREIVSTSPVPVVAAGGPRSETLDEALEMRSEEHTSELQSHSDLVCRLLLEKKKPTL